MEPQKRPETHTGNGHGKVPILASGDENMVEGLKLSPPDTGNGLKNTRPVSLREALSLWQTACFDLQSYGFKTAILAENNEIFLMISLPASIGSISVSNGHVLMDGLPVSEKE